VGVLACCSSVPAIQSLSLTLLGRTLALVLERLTFICGRLAVVGASLTLVGDPLALICEPFAFRKCSLAACASPLTLVSPRGLFPQVIAVFSGGHACLIGSFRIANGHKSPRVGIEPIGRPTSAGTTSGSMGRELGEILGEQLQKYRQSVRSRVARTLEQSADLAEAHAARHEAAGRVDEARYEFRVAARARSAAQRARAA
jgi:hypothetical protein